MMTTIRLGLQKATQAQQIEILPIFYPVHVHSGHDESSRLEQFIGIDLSGFAYPTILFINSKT